MTDFEDVGDFHHKFGLDSVNHYLPGPRNLSNQDLEFRLNFLLEELTELVKASGGKFVFDPIDPHMNALAIKMPGHPESQAKVNDVEVFDALIDLNYVSLGTAHLLGYPWPGGWKEVQEANMAKRRASSASESGRGSALDVIKPEGWTPPDLGRVLKDYDFDIEDDA